MSKQGKCGTCKYWDKWARAGESDYGNCNRYPPVLDHLRLQEMLSKIETFDEEKEYFADGNLTLWGRPVTNEWEFCGEYYPLTPC